jgi:hypothetical protein
MIPALNRPRERRAASGGISIKLQPGFVSV